jgi:hypothetical protein
MTAEVAGKRGRPRLPSPEDEDASHLLVEPLGGPYLGFRWEVGGFRASARWAVDQTGEARSDGSRRVVLVVHSPAFQVFPVTASGSSHPHPTHLCVQGREPRVPHQKESLSCRVRLGR